MNSKQKLFFYPNISHLFYLYPITSKLLKKHWKWKKFFNFVHWKGIETIRGFEHFQHEFLIETLMKIALLLHLLIENLMQIALLCYFIDWESNEKCIAFLFIYLFYFNSQISGLDTYSILLFEVIFPLLSYWTFTKILFFQPKI